MTLHDLFVVDRDLFWVTKDYAATLDEARRTHPAVIFMGDSCTQFGSYPENVVRRLADIDPALGSGVKVGTVGWSSEQGRVQATRDILPLGPRVITVYYGWNDHWVALGPPDSEARPNDVIWWLSQHTRLWQLATKFLRATPGSLEQRPLRVSLDRYLSNLEAIADAAQKNGVKVVLITAPSGHQEGHEPEYLALRHCGSFPSWCRCTGSTWRRRDAPLSNRAPRSVTPRRRSMPTRLTRPTSKRTAST